MSTTALQTVFPGTPKAFQTMMKRSAVVSAIVNRCHIEYSDDDLRREVEDEGRFEWVFDISTRGERGARAEWLFFPASVEQRISQINNPAQLPRQFLFEGVVRVMLPMGVRVCGGRAVEGPTLVTAWNCSTELVIDLIRAKHLRQFGESTFRRGNGGKAIIEISSIESFLKTRRIGTSNP